MQMAKVESNLSVIKQFVDHNIVGSKSIKIKQDTETVIKVTDFEREVALNQVRRVEPQDEVGKLDSRIADIQ